MTTRTAHRARRSRRKSKTTYPPDLHHPGHPSPSDTATVFPETTPPCELQRLSFPFKARKSASKKINPNFYHISCNLHLLLTRFTILQFQHRASQQPVQCWNSSWQPHPEISVFLILRRRHELQMWGLLSAPTPRSGHPTRFCSFFAAMKFQVILDPLGSDLWRNL